MYQNNILLHLSLLVSLHSSLPILLATFLSYKLDFKCIPMFRTVDILLADAFIIKTEVNKRED